MKAIVNNPKSLLPSIDRVQLLARLEILVFRLYCLCIDICMWSIVPHVIEYVRVFHGRILHCCLSRWSYLKNKYRKLIWNLWKKYIGKQTWTIKHSTNSARCHSKTSFNQKFMAIWGDEFHVRIFAIITHWIFVHLEFSAQPNKKCKNIIGEKKTFKIVYTWRLNKKLKIKQIKE